jgi:outer membrane protein
MNGTDVTRAIIVALTIGISGTAAAQETPMRVTLPEALTRAEQNSLRVTELQARVDAAAAAQAGREAADRPAVLALGGYTRTNHVEEFALVTPNQPPRLLYPDAPDNYRARLDLQWPIYSAGRAGALVRAAGAERDAATFDVAAARLDLRLETTRAFWALITARGTEAVVARALETLDVHLRDLQSRLQQGFIPPNDVLSAEAQRSRQRLLAIEATNLRRVAEADLRRLMGVDGAPPIEPVAAVDVPPALSPDVAAALAEARKQRPERQALASRAAAAREREQAIAAGGKPQVAVAAGYDYARPNPRIFPRLDAWRDSWDASVNVSWSLWDGGRRRAEAAEAHATTRALTARADDFDRQLTFEIEQRSLDLESAIAAIAAADDGVRAAAEARRVLGERYNAGVATSTDVLDAQTAVLQAELDRTRAIANTRLATARLERALGR